MEERTYIAIDLKSFYASVECMERGLDPLTTNLVVADPDRTEKTICLAVSPALKSYGIPGRARLFEVVQRIREVNAVRRANAPGRALRGESDQAPVLAAHPEMAVAYITAPPQMAHYMEISWKIHGVYLKYIAPEDIFVYSIDEVFLDVTGYLDLYQQSAHELAMTMIREVLAETGITATAGIGTNLYLCKVAMDVMAKHVPADADGVRIAELDEMSYRRSLWTHRPITDFWRVGRGTAARLEKFGVYTMGDVALLSASDEGEDLLYREFGVNAELLIDHAWGWEPCTMADVKAHRPATNSICSGQILPEPYDYEKTRMIVREMTELMALELVEKGLVTDQFELTIGYDTENLINASLSEHYQGEIVKDRYGRKVPKHAHGTEHTDRPTSSTRLILDTVLRLYDRITDRSLLIRRLQLTAARLIREEEIPEEPVMEQLDLFTDYEAREAERAAEEAALAKERKLQEASLAIQKKFGKNALLKGTSLQEGATTRKRNQQIGGHKA